MLAKADTAMSGRFTVVDATGELVDADSLPTGQLVTNGVNDVATITVTNIGTGDYRWQMTTPDDLTEGDHVEIVISATIDSINTAGRVYSASIVDKFPGELAEPGDEMDLVDAPNATAIDAIQDGLSTFDAATEGVDVDFVEGTDATDYFSALITTILAKVQRWFSLIFRKDAEVKADLSAELAELNEDYGTGAGSGDNEADSLQAIRDRGDDAWTTGAGGDGGGEPGGVNVTIPIQDEDANPIPDVRVWVTADADGDTLVDGAYRTNTSGEVTFTLIAGNTYYLWAQKASQQAVQGEEFVAVAD